MFKFNIGHAVRGKAGLAGIRGVLHNSKGEVLFMFSKHVGVRNSNKAEVLAILEGLCSILDFYIAILLLKVILLMLLLGCLIESLTLLSSISYLMKSKLYPLPLTAEHSLFS